MIVIDEKVAFRLHKSLDIELAPGLNTKEFKCRCVNPNCHYTLVGPRLINSWLIVRLKFAKKLKINSGFRCQKYNAAVGGVDESKHTTGEAIDISREGFKSLEITYLKELLVKNFDTVIEYSDFYHCHNN
jgi:hypothetical protein